MANKTRNLAVAMLLAARTVWGFDGIGDAGTGGPTVLVRVSNAANIPLSALDQAQREVHLIYARAGVSLVWKDDVARAPSEVPPEGWLDVRLLSKFAGERILSGSELPGTALGVAPIHTRRAYILCERIRRRALSDGLSFETVLGRVLAHEIGHLLLPNAGHSKIGIMRARVDYRSEEPPGFTHAEVASMRALWLRLP